MAVGKKETAQRKMPVSVKFAFFLVMVAGVIFFPTTVLFCGLMLPTFVAALVDNHPQKTLWLTVGSVNMAGLLPSWVTLWEEGHTLTAALQLLTDPRTLLTAYGAAGIGWFIFYNITPLIASIMIRKSERRQKDIVKRQKELARKWGPEVGLAEDKLAKD